MTPSKRTATATTRRQHHAAPPAAELERLAGLRHADPHAVLGLHPLDGGMVVRVLRPDAATVELLPAEGPPRALERVHESGLFAALLPECGERFAYKLRATLQEGRSITWRDPYAFPPSLGELDLYLFGEGRHERIYDKLGAHLLELDGAAGVSFAVWAPNARGVSLVGDFNGWDGRLHPMRALGHSGIWELFLPDVEAGARYKFEIRGADGRLVLKADPYANQAELPPQTASLVTRSAYKFQDDEWIARRAGSNPQRAPLSVYELHLGSWRRKAADGEGIMGYRELAPLLAAYITDMGFTHVELMPISEHPFGGSWGYQVGSYFAPTARYGTPDDLRYFIDVLHQHNIGVLLDWVPAHFPKDDFSLGRFDGTALYEHLSPLQGEHPDWGTYIFNYNRNEVVNFLIASALYWLDAFHFDGLRLDAVASMLYLDYSRKAGEWMPNRHGGRENLEAIAFIKSLNEVTHAHHPGVLIVAEESTAWPGVSRPTYLGGLGFGFKWNMGWMHDTLLYFSKSPIHRRFHHNDLTFSLVYAWSENFILPFSHDEVVHGKGSLLDKMPGDRWQKFANLRALYGFMWAHPGRKLLFMGCEFGQWREWNHDRSLDWHLLEEPDHRGLQALVRDLNALYRRETPLWAADSEAVSFQWIDAHDADSNCLSFIRIDPGSGRELICVCNLSPVVREGHRLGLPMPGLYVELLNTDSEFYGGGGVGNWGAIEAEPIPWHGQPYSASIVLPPLGTVWFAIS